MQPPRKRKDPSLSQRFQERFKLAYKRIKQKEREADQEIVRRKAIALALAEVEKDPRVRDELMAYYVNPLRLLTRKERDARFVLHGLLPFPSPEELAASGLREAALRARHQDKKRSKPPKKKRI